MEITETLEEAAERLSELQEGTYRVQHKITYKHGFIDGHKAATKVYSEEEAIGFYLWARKKYGSVKPVELNLVMDMN
jgi:hypothetical protein